MFNNIKNFFKHPIISIYNTGVQIVEKYAEKKIKRKLRYLEDPEARIEQYHVAGYMNRDILKHIRKRETANLINVAHGHILNNLTLLPSLDIVGEEYQEKQIKSRTSKKKLLAEFKKNLDASINTVLSHIKASGADVEVIAKFMKAYEAADSKKVFSFYKRNRDDFESIFVKYLGDVNDIEEVLDVWTKELS